MVYTVLAWMKEHPRSELGQMARELQLSPELLVQLLEDLAQSGWVKKTTPQQPLPGSCEKCPAKSLCTNSCLLGGYELTQRGLGALSDRF
ncbi:MAG TPA: FeoC-like transcriptional regulator [Thermotogota bacterium]|nr:FeoC-like transcriptional regulator [Thermotogota bacterium]HRW92863.1 FeoC-like transcriptional regulator [Thermotogota bacterium]